MERRVIKFNLMTAIVVCTLIILAIIGIIWFAVNRNSGKNTSKKEKNQQQVIENKEEYNELDEKATVDIDGEDVEITMKKFVSELNYKMNYAADKFYFDGNRELKDVFKSLESDTIIVEISKTDEGFKAKSEDLVSGQSERRKANESYRSNAVELNGKICPIEQEQKETEFNFNYYIPVENSDAYYTVNVRCAQQFIDSTIPVVDKMMESFEIM